MEAMARKRHTVLDILAIEGFAVKGFRVLDVIVLRDFSADGYEQGLGGITKYHVRGSCWLAP